MSNSGKLWERLLIMGHRGARQIAPENTLAAYQLALEVGVDAIELDVHLCQDDELVVLHDSRLERTTDGRGEVRDHPLAELKRLNAAAKHTGSGDTSVERIPTLQEVYDRVQGRTQINVEVKTDGNGQRYPGIEQKVVDLVRRNRAVPSTIISSFDFPTLKTISALAPEIRIYAIVSGEYFQTIGSGGPGPVVADLAGRGFNWVAVNKTYLSEPLVDGLHSAGIAVHAWVINEAAEMESFVAMGVDAITTDRPDILVPEYRKGRPEQPG